MGKFLCSHCRTEQNVEDIIAGDQLKVCLCPGCHEVCCDDFCVFFMTGRWCPPEPSIDPMLHGAIGMEKEIEEAEEEDRKEMAQWLQAYEDTKRAYGLV